MGGILSGNYKYHLFAYLRITKNDIKNEVLKMVNRKTTLLLAVLSVLGVAFYISASTAFVVLLLGLLFVPPALMVGAALVQGASIISGRRFRSEKEGMVISV